MTLLLREPFVTLGAWSNLGGASLVAGRTGQGLQVAGTSSRADFRFPPSAESEYVTVGFALKPNQASFAWMFSLGSDDGATSHIHILTTSDGGFEARLGPNGVTFGVTVGGLYTTTGYCYVEVQARLHSTDGSVTIRVDGVERLALTGLNTRNGGTKAVLDTVRLGWLQFFGHVYDDMYVATGASETFRGDMVIAATTEAQNARQSARVGFSDPQFGDWQRSARQAVRVAFTGANTNVRLGGIEARVLRRPTGGNALVSAYQLRVLLVPGGGTVLLGGAHVRVLRAFAAPLLRFWDGSAYVAGPVSTWDGTVFRPALAVRTWDGSTWVDAL